jgi:ABC-type Zn uptake system ZnuABC Zn-binding protein ZnuA
MRENGIPVLFAANYFSHDQVEQVAERTGAQPLIAAEHVGGAPGVDDYFDLVDHWVSGLARAFEDAAEDEE